LRLFAADADMLPQVPVQALSSGGGAGTRSSGREVPLDQTLAGRC